MKKLFVFLSHDEATNKFSTSKFLVMASFYFILFLNGRALYLDREIKSSNMITDTFTAALFLYFGRRVSFTSKDTKIGSQRATNDDKESE